MAGRVYWAATAPTFNTLYQGMTIYRLLYVLQYSINNGTSWSTITTTTHPSTTSTVTYGWAVPNGISSTQCLVRVYSTNYPTITDTSNAVFSIQPNTTITVTSPNGGELFTPSASRTITWTNTPRM